MRILALLFLISSSVFAKNNNKCSFYQSSIISNWTLTSTGLEIQFSNTNLANNQWTGIIFGDSMDSLSMVIFENLNNQAIVQTGSMSGIGNESLDSTSQATLQSATISGSSLNALVTLPSTFDGVDLASCHTWRFIATGAMTNGQMGQMISSPMSVSNVCPNKCS